MPAVGDDEELVSANDSLIKQLVPQKVIVRAYIGEKSTRDSR